MSFVPTQASRTEKGIHAPDFRGRAELTELMDEPCSRQELRACLQDLAKLNRWFLGYRPTLAWLDSIIPARAQLRWNARPLRILDVGCGYGDGLRRIARWAEERGVKVQLTGLDLNSDAIAIAAEASQQENGILWACSDVFAYEPAAPVDLVVSSLFTHHLRDAQAVAFIQWMERHAQIGWFINDLSRNVVPYYLLASFAKVARLHRFVQHDGPVSIARSFRSEDWEKLCASAGLQESAYRIQPYTPARLCVARTK